MIVDLIEPTIEQKLAEKFSDPVTFIETFLKFKGKPFRLYPYQKHIARTTDFLQDRIVIQKGRQVGGSLLVSALIVYYSFITNDAVFLIVSKTQEQSGFIASYTRRFFYSNPILSEIVDRKKTTKDNLWLKNGTVIYNRTAGNNEADNLRGISLENKGCCVWDESAYISERAFRTLIHIGHNAGEVHCSTPRRPSGYFHTICHSDDYKKFKVPANRCPHISKTEIERMRRLLRPSEYKTDILGEFAAGENQVFDSNSIEKSINNDLPLFDSMTFDFGDNFPFTSNPNKNYVYSLDVAKAGGDDWILTIGDLDHKNNTMEVVAYHAWRGTEGDEDENVTLTDNPDTIIRDILQYTNRFTCTKFYVDTTSNDYFAHVLLNKHLIPVEKVVWSLQKKERMIEHLATCFRAEKMGLPNDPEMINQLLDFSYDTKRMENDAERRIYLAGGDDDYVASLCMLSQSLTGETISRGGFIDAW